MYSFNYDYFDGGAINNWFHLFSDQEQYVAPNSDYMDTYSKRYRVGDSYVRADYFFPWNIRLTTNNLQLLQKIDSKMMLKKI